MKKLIFSIAFLFTACLVHAQVGIGTIMPDGSTQLDVVSTDRGILIPRVELQSATDATTINNGNKLSLLVFNTNTMATDLAAGYCYWDGAKWQRLTNADDLAALETLTSLVDNGDGTLTYTDEAGTANVVPVSALAGNVAVTDGTVDIDNDGTPDNGVNLQDVIDNLNNIVQGNESLTTLGMNADGINLDYRDEEGNTSQIDLSTVIAASADITTDAWVDGAGLVELGTLSDGVTARPVGTEFVALDNGNVGIGTATPTQILEVTDEALIDGMRVGVGGVNSPNDNVAVGQNALTNNTGVENVGVGNNALASTTTGVFNVAVGSGALENNTTGLYNVAVGRGALASNTIAVSNVAVGMDALSNNMDGVNNIAIGESALYSNTGGHGNIAIGRLALQNVITGSNNIALGNMSVGGIVPNNRNGNVFIGHRDFVSTPVTEDNTMFFSLDHIERMRIDDAGNLGIGTTTPNERLEVNGKVRISDLTGADLATDVIVTADATTGELKEAGTVASIGAATEPWFGTDDNAGATDNTEDIYTLGSVGIGTSTPLSGARLTIENLTGGAFIETTANASNGININSYRNHAFTHATFRGRAGRGTQAAPLAINAGDDLLYLDAQGHNGTAMSGLAASITYEAAENFTPAANGSNILFTTTNLGATNGTEKMRISADGNVGIGTTTPNEKLEVNGKVRISDLTGADLATDVIVTADATTGELKEGGLVSDLVTAAETNTTLALDNPTGVLTYTNEDNDNPTINLAAIEPWFGTDDNAGATDNTEDIYTLGNVGIGTATPTERLDVAGNIKIGPNNLRLQNQNLWSNDALNNSHTPAEQKILLYQTAPNSWAGIGNDNGGRIVLESRWLNGGFVVKTGTAGDVRMYINPLGNIGLGTTAPNEKLEVNGKVRVSDLTGADLATDVIVTADATTGELKEAGTLAAVIAASADATTDAWVDAAGRVELGTQSDGSTARPAGTEFVALDNGDVGIGTTAPTAKTHIVDNVPSSTALLVEGYTGNSNASVLVDLKQNIQAGGENDMVLRLEDTNPAGIVPTGYLMKAFGDNQSVGAATDLDEIFAIRTNGEVRVNTDHLVVQPAGNVGIGTATPSQRLDVSGGDVQFEDYPNTRDDSGATAVNNVLYTDATGNILSAPIAAVSTTYTAGNLIDITGTVISKVNNIQVVTVAPTVTIDAASVPEGIYRYDMAAQNNITINNFINPVDGGVYNFHFLNATAGTVTFPASFVREDGTALGTMNIATAEILTFYHYQGTNYSLEQ